MDVAEWTKYLFHEERAGNGVEVSYAGPYDKFSEGYVARRLRGHSAGMLVTAVCVNKERDEVLSERHYRLTVSKTIPGVLNEWNEKQPDTTVCRIEPLRGEGWHHYRMVETDKKKDADRIPEVYIDGEASVHKQRTKNLWDVKQGTTIVCTVDDEDLALAIAAGSHPLPQAA
jgi:hypothetical protein